ncbi:MAG: penicillin-binding transpeptidase domain-containing protein [Terriglobales bacterium]
MVPVNKIALLLVIGVLALTPAKGPPILAAFAENAPARSSLFAQSAAQILGREFTSREISFLLLDVRTGAVLASGWDHADQPIPLGSLVKPFTALAYGEEHQFRYPIHACRGAEEGCWLTRGHGEIGITAAIADSCNAYFRMLTARMTSADVIPAASRLGLDPPAPDLSGPDLIGIGNRWLISPLHMAHAYLELNRRRDQPGVREVVEGMDQSARQGTGSEVDRALQRSSALVKTGTAVCTHRDRAPGDGFVVALVPAEQPELLLMVRVHGVPGARAALTAGRMLRRIEE